MFVLVLAAKSLGKVRMTLLVPYIRGEAVQEPGVNLEAFSLGPKGCPVSARVGHTKFMTPPLGMRLCSPSFLHFILFFFLHGRFLICMQ